MEPRYEPLGRERFSVEHDALGEFVRIKAPRQWFALLFLPFWLVIWTIGGCAALYTLIAQFQLFLLVWLIFWALGWVSTAGTILWMAAGSETIRKRGPDLEIAHHLFGISRRWLYRGQEIDALSVAPQPGWPFSFRWQVPFVRSPRGGSIKFNYGPRTIYVAPGLDEGEAEMIIDRLGRI